jgi:hypothetical protein
MVKGIRPRPLWDITLYFSEAVVCITALRHLGAGQRAWRLGAPTRVMLRDSSVERRTVLRAKMLESFTASLPEDEPVAPALLAEPAAALSAAAGDA